MASLTEIKAAGLKAAPEGGLGQFMTAVTQMAQGAQESRESAGKKEQEKTEFYIKLREAGYSEDQAKSKVAKVYQGGFVERILGKEKAFEGPETDIIEGKQEKERLEREKMRSEIDKNAATAEQRRRGESRGFTAQNVLKNKAAKQRAIQSIRSGKVYDKTVGIDSTINFDNPDDVLAYVTSLDIDIDDPDIQAALAERFPDKYKQTKTPEATGATVRRKTKDDRIAIFDAKTKQFIRYE